MHIYTTVYMLYKQIMSMLGFKLLTFEYVIETDYAYAGIYTTVYMFSLYLGPSGLYMILISAL